MSLDWRYRGNGRGTISHNHPNHYRHLSELVNIIFLGIWEHEIQRKPRQKTPSWYSASPRCGDEVDLCVERRLRENAL